MIEIDEENPLWKPGAYPHDSEDGVVVRLAYLGKEPRGVSVHLYG